MENEKHLFLLAMISLVRGPAPILLIDLLPGENV
jgi:hypothetical protein